MLKGISPLITPKLLWAMDAMGHGDSLVIADANFPGLQIAGDHPLIELPAVSATAVLKEMLKLFPVDEIHEHSGYVMQLDPADHKVSGTPEIWSEFDSLLKEAGSSRGLGNFERQEFYAQARNCRVVIQTGESRLYGNLILYKGVL
ncbi:MAG: RbsD/FucU family protein [Succinivibrio sp.]|jgi:L-fucose mutarotase|nr:RbsD/FucU family protein [Succinivibrio sp.]